MELEVRWSAIRGEEEEEDALEWRGFQDGVDLCLGVIEQTNAREKKGERERDMQKSTKQFNINMIETKLGMYA